MISFKTNLFFRLHNQNMKLPHNKKYQNDTNQSRFDR